MATEKYNTEKVYRGCSERTVHDFCEYKLVLNACEEKLLVSEIQLNIEICGASLLSLVYLHKHRRKNC